MPEYRATRFISTREANTYDFIAENDEEALEALRLGDNLRWSDDADLVESDTPDEVLALDRRKDDGSYETIDDEIELPGHMPYGGPSREFVRNVAKFGGEGAYHDAIETLDKLIREARALCGFDPAQP
jgi:hypothetical protein